MATTIIVILLLVAGATIGYLYDRIDASDESIDSDIDRLEGKLADLREANQQWKQNDQRRLNEIKRLARKVQQQEDEIHRLTQLQAADGTALFRIQNVLDDRNTEHSIQVSDDQRETD